MPKSLQVLAKLPQLLKKVKGDPIKVFENRFYY